MDKHIKNENGTVTIKAIAEVKDWKEAQKKAFTKIKSNLKVSGFRDGKNIPDQIAKTHIKDADVFNEAFKLIAEKLYEKVLTENKITPIIEPELSFDKVTKDELEVTFVITVYPEVTLGEYKNIKIKKDKITVSDEEINSSIEKIANDNSMLKTTDSKAKLGDTVIMDFKGFIDGKAFEGGNASNYSLELGSNQFIPGFEQQLVGVKANEKKEVKVTFPTQYVKELAGKDATFVCAIHEVKEKIVPEINDDFVKTLEMKDIDTLEKLKIDQKEKILKQKEQNQMNERYNKLIDEISNNAHVTISNKIIDKEVLAMKENLSNRVSQNGITLQQYLEILNQTEVQLNESLKTEAEKNLKVMFVLGKIAEVEKLQVSQKDIDDEIENMSKTYNRSVDEVKEALKNQMEDLRRHLQDKKIYDFLTSQNLN